MRFKNIDWFKGLLTLLVILGHVLQGKMDETIWRTMIYSFHMPLFVGISGFLLNVDKLVDLDLIALVKKYLFRVIIPWTIAIIFYYVYVFAVLQDQQSNVITGLIKAFIHPYYHLWFIPGFLSWVILTWILKKLGIGDRQLLVTALLLSIGFIILKKYPEIYRNLGVIESGIEVILHTFRPYFYFFFVFGLMYRRVELNKPRLLEYILPVICFAFVIYLFYNPNRLLSTVNFFLFNGLLLSLVLKISVSNLIGDSKVLEWFGLNSLAIYLWHVLPILICKYVIGTESLAIFYLGVISMELVFVIAYTYLIKIDFLRKYVFGM